MGLGSNQRTSQRTSQRPGGTPGNGWTGIGELADEFGLTPRTIRFYEDKGLLTPARENNQRVYSHRDRVRLGLICRGKRLGFTLTEIKEFLKLYEADDNRIEQMRFLLHHGRERIAALESQWRDVEETLHDLRDLVAAAEEYVRRVTRP